MRAPQIVALGCTWRLRSGRWQEIQPGVYLIGGAPRTSRSELMAACLWGGPTAFASHRAAGDLWSLAGVDSGFIEIAVDRCLRSGSVIVHRLPAPPEWVLHRDSIPVSNPTTTIFHLAAVLPPFRLEVALFSVFDEDGRFVARPDFAYPRAKVAVEAQSYAFHHDRQQWETDQRRLNSLVALGWRVIYVTARQMRQKPDVVAAQIHSTLQRGVAPPL